MDNPFPFHGIDVKANSKQSLFKQPTIQWWPTFGKFCDHLIYIYPVTLSQAQPRQADSHMPNYYVFPLELLVELYGVVQMHKKHPSPFRNGHAIFPYYLS